MECMEERQVTIDGVSYRPGNPFFVIATQNPVESAGTFPLPEAQMDRFMMRLSMGLPDREEELAILERYMQKEPLDELGSILSLEELANVRAEANRVFVHTSILEYMVDIVGATRSASVVMGVSPRGSLALLRCAKSYAYLAGRSYVIPDDVKAVAVPVLAHRIVTGSFGMDRQAAELVENIVAGTPVPTEDFGR